MLNQFSTLFMKNGPNKRSQILLNISFHLTDLLQKIFIISKKPLHFVTVKKLLKEYISAQQGAKGQSDV